MRADGRFLRHLLAASLIIVITGCQSDPAGVGTDRLPLRAAESNLDIARREFGRGNYGNAIEYLEKELAQKPASVAALNGLGACYDQLGRFDVAQRYYFRALDLAPESSQTLSNIGYSYLQQGRHREAEAILELSLQKDADNQVAANNLSLARAGNVSEASPVQVARSTNNGVDDDELDFRALLALIQGPGGTASGIAVGQPSQNNEGRSAAVITPAGATSAILRATAETDSLTAVEPADPESATAQEVDVGVDEVEMLASPALQPARIEQPATITQVREEFVVETPVLEPVSGPEPLSRETAQLTLTILDTPQLDLARASDVTPTLAMLAEPLKLVIQNGNGVRGIARATSNWLQGDKLDIESVHDADSYDYPQTVIFYRPELQPYAEEIAATLNLSCQLIPSDELTPGADVQVILGHDFASQVSVANGDLSFEPLPSTDYLQGSIRVEVANGNGVNGMAAQLREYLKDKGANVVRITDAENFDYQESLLYFRTGTRTAAEAVAASLPLAGVLLIETESLGPEIDARLVVGRDFIPLANMVLN